MTESKLFRQPVEEGADRASQTKIQGLKSDYEGASLARRTMKELKHTCDQFTARSKSTKLFGHRHGEISV